MSLPVNVVGAGSHRVICLHGWFGSAEGWGPFIHALDTDAFTYAFMDYRGYGARQGEAGSYTMDEIASDALALADQLGWDTFSLVGHSMGGMAIQKVVAESSGRVQRIVGINPVPATGVPFDDQSWGLFSGAAENDANRFAIIDFTTGNRLTSTWINEMVEFSVANSTRPAFGEYLNAWAKSDFQASLVGNSVPALAIVGEHDPAITADVMSATWMNAFPNGELQVFANAGHYPMFETPVALASAVEGFLRG